MLQAVKLQVVVLLATWQQQQQSQWIVSPL
jgi:hypothetical protein